MMKRVPKIIFIHKVPVSVIFNFVVNGEYYDLKYNLNLNHNEVVVLNFIFSFRWSHRYV